MSRNDHPLHRNHPHRHPGDLVHWDLGSVVGSDALGGDDDMVTLSDTDKIQITSGEGVLGTTKIYTGKRTNRALKSRLTRERCGGDRWARAVIYSHETEWGSCGIDYETGEMHAWVYISYGMVV